MRGPSQNRLYAKEQCLSIYCVKKEEKSTTDTIYSMIAHIRIKSIKIKLDKEKTAMLWEKYPKNLQKEIGRFINFV